MGPCEHHSTGVARSTSGSTDERLARLRNGTPCCGSRSRDEGSPRSKRVVRRSCLRTPARTRACRRVHRFAGRDPRSSADRTTGIGVPDASPPPPFGLVTHATTPDCGTPPQRSEPGRRGAGKPVLRRFCPGRVPRRLSGFACPRFRARLRAHLGAGSGSVGVTRAAIRRPVRPRRPGSRSSRDRATCVRSG